MGDSQPGALLPTPRGEPAGWRTQRGACGPCGGVSRVHPRGPPAALALAGLARGALAGAFIGAGGDPSPRGEMVRTGPRRRAVPSAATTLCGGMAGAPRAGIEPAHGRRPWAADLRARRLTTGHGLVAAVQRTQQRGQHHAMGRLAPASTALANGARVERRRPVATSASGWGALCPRSARPGWPAPSPP